MKLILASSSPRRQELLKMIAEDFEIYPADIDETLPEDIYVQDSAEFLAVQKAQKVAPIFQKDMVIGCDTVVLLDGNILGKPKDEQDAFRMLSLLSGRTHQVITGVCLIQNGETQAFSESTEVEFYTLSSQEIREYIATGEPFDKAGGYGIQGKGGVLVKRISGDFYNVVGLPVGRLKRALSN